LTYFIILVVACYFAFQFGRRHEVGKREVAAAVREEEAYTRSRRGTVRLRPIRIRR
jgi:hypothetical protein